MKTALFDILFGTFIVLVFLQLGAPFLAQRIKDRFQTLGTIMKANPAFAWLNVSHFWREARKLQETARDPLVARFLHVCHAWWAAVLLVLFSIVMVAAF